MFFVETLCSLGLFLYIASLLYTASVMFMKWKLEIQLDFDVTLCTMFISIWWQNLSEFSRIEIVCTEETILRLWLPFICRCGSRWSQQIRVCLSVRLELPLDECGENYQTKKSRNTMRISRWIKYASSNYYYWEAQQRCHRTRSTGGPEFLKIFSSFTISGKKVL